MGPSQHPTLGGGRYFLSLIDDYSRKVWVYILRSKDEAFQRFKDWKVSVEVQTGRKIKKLRTDNGWSLLTLSLRSIVKRRAYKGTKLSLIPLSKMGLLRG